LTGCILYLDPLGTTDMKNLTATMIEDPDFGMVAHLAVGNLSAQIAPKFGSNVFSFEVDGMPLIHTDRAKLLEHKYTGNFIIFPAPNRVRDRKFTYNGVTADMQDFPQRGGDEPLIHGLLHEAEFEYSDPVFQNDVAVFETSIVWDENQPFFHMFPWKCRFIQRYELSSAGLKQIYSVENLGDTTLPFGYARHPSFIRCSGDETTLMIPAEALARMDDSFLPTGEWLDVRGVMFRQFDLRGSVHATADLRLDHVFKLEAGKHPIIDHTTKGVRIHLKSSDEFRFCVCHTLAGTIELEPQTCSTDPFNAADPKEAGLLEVAPGETRTGFIMYEVEQY
jgi:aldose 1-epimerase